MTFIEALDKLMPGFDNEIAKMAQRTLITPRNIDYHTGVLAAKVTPGIPGVKPVLVDLVDFKTREPVQTLELDAVLVATGRCAGARRELRAALTPSPALRTRRG